MATDSPEDSDRPHRKVPLALHVGRDAPPHVITGVTTLGRAADNDIVVPDPTLAAHQLRLVSTDEGVAITSLDPRAALMLPLPGGGWGGQVVGEAVVWGPSEFKIGDTLLCFDFALPEPRVHPGAHGLVGRAPAIEALRRTIDACAAHDRPVLLEGPCSFLAMKAAEAIHAASRREGPVARESSSVLSVRGGFAHLFGQTEAAFEGAAPLRGNVGYCERGTLILDAFEYFPAEGVPPLLQLIRERTVTRLGAKEPTPANVRLILVHIPQPRELVHLQVQALVRECERVPIPSVLDYAEDLPELIAFFTEREHLGAGVEWSEEAIAVVRREASPMLYDLRALVSRTLLVLEKENYPSVVEARDVLAATGKRIPPHWLAPVRKEVH